MQSRGGQFESVEVHQFSPECSWSGFSIRLKSVRYQFESGFRHQSMRDHRENYPVQGTLSYKRIRRRDCGRSQVWFKADACEASTHGFKSHRPPQFSVLPKKLARLISKIESSSRHVTLNNRCKSGSPDRKTEGMKMVPPKALGSSFSGQDAIF